MFDFIWIGFAELGQRELSKKSKMSLKIEFDRTENTENESNSEPSKTNRQNQNRGVSFQL